MNGRKLLAAVVATVTALVVAPVRPADAAPTRTADTIRVATYNASLNRSAPGALVADLRGRDDAQAKAVAEVIQRNRPDVLLINEFDYTRGGEADALFRRNYLQVSQNGQRPIDYRYA